MLEKRTECVLKYLADRVGGNFAVLSKEEILQQLPQKYNFDGESLSAEIKFLKQNEYVTVKYQDADDLCIAVTDKTSAYLMHTKLAEEKASLSRKQYALVFLFGFLGAFVGSVLAALLCHFAF